MKKLLLIITFAFMALCSNAQSNGEHLKFKGVPIDGTVTEFAKKLEEKGFKTLMNIGDTYIMTGDFAGYPNCTIYFLSTKSTKEVYSVGVVPSYSDTWSELISQYDTFKKNLTIKYGKPEGCIETFNGGTPSSDLGKIYATEMGDCNYRTWFKTENGSIAVTITNKKKGGEKSSYVILIYTDKVNEAKEKQNVIDDL